MLRNLHLGLANGLPNVAVVVILLDILYGVALVNSYILYYFIVKFDGVGGLKGSKEVVVAAGIRRSVVSAARSYPPLGHGLRCLKPTVNFGDSVDSVPWKVRGFAVYNT